MRELLLVCNHDLERAHDLREGDALVLFPGLKVLDGIDEHNEVISAALVVDLGDSCVPTRHGGRRCVCRRGIGGVGSL